MKKIFQAIAICGFLFASCGNHSNNNATHTHDDGSVHSDHATEQARPAQESFKTNADTGTLKTDSLKKKQENHTHDHGDGKPHKH
jgi:hypothetical protein